MSGKNKNVCVVNGVVCSENERIESFKAVYELSKFIIASQSIPNIQQTESQVWTLTVDKSSNSAKVLCQDTDGNEIGFITLKLKPKNFPSPLSNGIKLYLHDGVIRFAL